MHSFKLKEDTVGLYNDACVKFTNDEKKKPTQDEVIKKALGVYIYGNARPEIKQD